LFPKEATEIYCDGKVIYINDFKEMKYVGFDSEEAEGKITLEKTEKGQAIEVDELADAIINDTEPPNGPIGAARGAVMSFYANDSIETGKEISICEQDYVF